MVLKIDAFPQEHGNILPLSKDKRSRTPTSIAMKLHRKTFTRPIIEESNVKNEKKSKLVFQKKGEKDLKDLAELSNYSANYPSSRLIQKVSMYFKPIFLMIIFFNI